MLTRFTVALMGLFAFSACGSDEASQQFVYSELTAAVRPIRYLLDANAEGKMVGGVPSTTQEGALDGFVFE